MWYIHKLDFNTPHPAQHFWTKIIMYSNFLLFLHRTEDKFKSQVALPGNAGYNRKHYFKLKHFLQSTCSKWPFRISSSWLNLRRPPRKTENLKHYLVPSRRNLKSCCFLCPRFVLGCWGQPHSHSALSSLSHRSSTACNSSGVHIVAQLSKFSSSHLLVPQKQPAESLKKVLESS